MLAERNCEGCRQCLSLRFLALKIIYLDFRGRTSGEYHNRVFKNGKPITGAGLKECAKERSWTIVLDRVFGRLVDVSWVRRPVSREPIFSR